VKDIIVNKNYQKEIANKSLLCYHTSCDLVRNRSSCVTLHTLLDNEALNIVSIGNVLSPNHGVISHDSIARPSLLAVQDVTPFNFLGKCLHAGGVTSIVGLGETETGYLIEGYQFGKEAGFLLLITASLVN